MKSHLPLVLVLWLLCSGVVCAQAGSNFFTITPCRVLDTRSSPPKISTTPRTIQVTGSCSIPTGAIAVAGNLAAVAPAFGGYVTVYPTGPLPPVSSLNFDFNVTRANNFVASLSTTGQLNLFASGDSVDALVDLSGYFVPSDAAGYWPLNELTGSTAFDYSGKGNNGTITGTVTVPGVISHGRRFSGADVILVPDSTGLRIPGDITIEAWVHPDDYSTWQTVVNKSPSNGSPPQYDGNYDLSLTPAGYIRFGHERVGGSFPILYDSTATVPLSAWTHVAVSWGSGRVRFYRNGILVTDLPDQGEQVATNNNPLRIGYRPDGNSFRGKLDEVKVWPYQRGSGDIAAAVLGSCISSGTQSSITAALAEVESVALLCPSASFNLSSTVFMTQNKQEIYTLGLPVDTTRATLRITSSSIFAAVYAADTSNTKIRNVIIDGNRPVLGAQGYPGGALIELGAEYASASGQVVDSVNLVEPRGWSAMHFGGGPDVANPSCTNGTITNNAIGPAGQPDGTWADGISNRCTTTLISGNVITDATDGAIVLFAPTGASPYNCTVTNNTITASSRQLLGGVHMVVPGGNYSGTFVQNNTISANGAFIRVALPMGGYTWQCTTDAPLAVGATVRNNTLAGSLMGYGYAVDGVTGWTVTDNVDLSTHVGRRPDSCNGAPPAGFQKHGIHVINSSLQIQFAEAIVEALPELVYP
jgi:hypothetical protein